MALPAAHETLPDQEGEPVWDRLTLRAFVLGLVTIVGMCLYATYYGRNLMKSFLPVTALLPLVVWIGINTLLKLTVPRIALSRTEVMTIFGMVWLVGTVPAVGWVGYLITDISAPAAFSSPENRFWEVVAPIFLGRFILRGVIGPLSGCIQGWAPASSFPGKTGWFRCSGGLPERWPWSWLDFLQVCCSTNSGWSTSA